MDLVDRLLNLIEQFGFPLLEPLLRTQTLVVAFFFRRQDRVKGPQKSGRGNPNKPDRCQTSTRAWNAALKGTHSAKQDFEVIGNGIHCPLPGFAPIRQAWANRSQLSFILGRR